MQKKSKNAAQIKYLRKLTISNKKTEKVRVVFYVDKDPYLKLKKIIKGRCKGITLSGWLRTIIDRTVEQYKKEL